MSSLVLELQQEAMDSTTDVSAVLRKSLVVATKLDLSEFQAWIESELNGYSQGKLPDYRKVSCSIQARNPYHGWIPIVFGDCPELAETLSLVPIGHSVAELEALAKSDSDSEFLICDFPPRILEDLRRMGGDCFRLGLIPKRLISKASISAILGGIRNTVLRWSLQLEKDGILGDGLTFSADERKAAASATYHVQHFYGSVGTVAGGDVRQG